MVIYHGTANGLGWWFGARWFGIFIPLSNNSLSEIDPRNPNHRAPNHEFTFKWHGTVRKKSPEKRMTWTWAPDCFRFQDPDKWYGDAAMLTSSWDPLLAMLTQLKTQGFFQIYKRSRFFPVTFLGGLSDHFRA